MGSIRLLLALSVIAAHCGLVFGSSFVGGSVAVQSFYIISGFYMTMILNEKYVGKNGSFRLFITNRFIRIFPIYWVVLAASVIFVAGMVWATGVPANIFHNFSSIRTHVAPFTYLSLTNVVIFGQDLAFFLGLNPESGTIYFTSDFWHTHPPLYTFLFIPQAWTLGLELTFYLIAPFILRKGIKTVATLIILSFLLRLTLFDYFNLRNDPWNYRFFPSELMFFLLGYICYQIYLRLKTMTIAPYISIATLSVCIAFTFFYSYLPGINLKWFPFSVKSMLYFSMIVLSVPILFNYFKKSKIDSKIGELSYPVYIVHLLVIAICVTVGDKYSLGFLKTGSVLALASILIAWLLNLAIATPIERFRQSRLKQPKPAPVTG